MGIYALQSARGGESRGRPFTMVDQKVRVSVVVMAHPYFGECVCTSWPTPSTHPVHINICAAFLSIAILTKAQSLECCSPNPTGA
mmetsp:Transcript_6283/g.11168  ORF Transcript_6283/g.11168 Transcript_6283/m.11168 type:complete len:85 (-) Transcript_6283:654-908(-)